MDTENLVVLLPHVVHCMGHPLHGYLSCVPPHTHSSTRWGLSTPHSAKPPTSQAMSPTSQSASTGSTEDLGSGKHLPPTLSIRLLEPDWGSCLY